MEKAASAGVSDGTVELHVGVEALAAARTEAAMAAEHEILRFERTPYVMAGTASVDPELHALQRGVALRAIHSPGIGPRQLAVIQFLQSQGASVRVGLAPIKLMVIDRRIALLPAPRAQADAPPSVSVIHSPQIAGTLADLFEDAWSNAVPLQAGEARAASLIALLMTGATDAVIASRMSVTERTVRRWIAELMRSYGVRTRLQLGAALARGTEDRPGR